MISRPRRLRTSEVAAVLKKGRGLTPQRYLGAKYLESTDQAGATIRAAAVVSKKVAKTAVMRNRIRRAVYDSLSVASTNLHAVGIKPIHIVLFIRSIPTTSLREAFTKDITVILSSLACLPARQAARRADA